MNILYPILPCPSTGEEIRKMGRGKPFADRKARYIMSIDCPMINENGEAQWRNRCSG
jgi:hypothetical protein